MRRGGHVGPPPTGSFVQRLFQGVIAGPDSGDTDADSRLDPGETWVYIASATATPGSTPTPPP